MVVFNDDALWNIFGSTTQFKGCKGSIVRLYIEDFMTYHKVELNAGANVNLIMGPNGTGKSTIVCAICLGLAGKATILGRATSLKEYIRHGAKVAIVEIELYNPSGSNWVVKRIIKETDTGASSIWVLNERRAPPDAVKKLMTSLNIQLDNLCQFLPQDRVQEFAKMDSVMLLQSTEQAIGSDTLARKHEALIGINKSIKQLEFTLKNHIESLRVEEQKNQRVETEVEAFQERERIKNKIAELHGKKAWFQFIKAMNIYSELNDEATKLTEKKTQAEKSIAPLQKLVRQLESNLIKYRERMSKLRADNLSKSNMIQRKFNSDKESNDIKINEIDAQLNQSIRSEESKTKRYNAAMSRIESLNTELVELLASGDKDELTLNRKLQEFDAVKSDLVRQLVDIQCVNEQDELEKLALSRRIQTSQNELNQLQDLRVSRMRFLEHHQRDLHKAVRYFENPENHRDFIGKIHEPMILHVYVNDLRYGKVAERFIGMSDLTAYFCENRDDVRTLVEITEKLGLRVSVIHHPAPNNFKRPVTSITQNQFKKFHFQKVLLDLLEAPDYYLSYLCKNCANKNCGRNCGCRMSKPENVPIGNTNTDKVISDVMNHTNLKYCFTDDYNYSIQTSYYSGKKNSSINFLQSARVFTDQINRNEREKLELAIRNAKENFDKLVLSISSREESKQLLTSGKAKVEEEIATVRGTLDSLKTLESKITQTRLTAEAISREKIDLDEVREKARADSLVARMSLFSSMSFVADAAVELSTNGFKHNVLKRQVSVLHSRSITKSSQYEEAKITIDEYTGQIREMNGKVRAASDQMEKCKKEAQAKSKLDKPPAEVSRGEIDQEEIEKDLNLNQAQLDFLPDTNPNIIRDYQQRKRQIEDMSKTKEQKENELISLQAQMVSLREEWLEPLNELISRIDTNFSKFFASMQCAGQIFLDKGEDEADFSKYGIKIKVKFRASEQLTELCGWKQSGGERAITTALYVLALQELTTVPFRVIDEINQGMDAKNEARFFNLLCSLANGASTPQYFLLTPKMLPPVTYPDNVDFHFILNGPHIDLPMQSKRPAGIELDDGENDDEDEETTPRSRPKRRTARRGVVDDADDD